MARDAFYFPHDSNARQDTKILKLRIKHGWAGYGLYWGIIEALRDQDNYSFDAEPELISLAVGCSVDELIPVLETCIEVGLLVNEDGEIYSKSLKRRMEHVNEIREKRREAGRKGGMARQRESTIEANVAQEESNAQANDEQMISKCLANEKQMLSSKGKEIKEKERESKEKERVLNTLKKAQRTKFVKDLFENQFWKLYPRKRAKQDALKAFMTLFPPSASKEQCNRRWKNIVLHIDALVAEGRPPDKIPYPATFLRRENFDEPPAEMTTSDAPEMEFVEVGNEDEN